MASLDKVLSAFQRIRARATIQHMTKEEFRRNGTPLVIDVRRDAAGESFEILKTGSVQLRVLDSTARHRHLLLAAYEGKAEDRFLCGHDERHWFVAGLPEQTEAANVWAAMEALKPDFVQSLERRKAGKHRRKSDVYMRQGEWFFIPCPHASIDPARVERNQPLVRGPGSKLHVCEFMYLDGEREYACARYPRLAFFETEYREILKTRRKAKQWGWSQLSYNPEIYVRGSVSHPDHATIYLDCWHRVELNRETRPLELRRTVTRPRLSHVKYRD